MLNRLINSVRLLFFSFAIKFCHYHFILTAYVLCPDKYLCKGSSVNESASCISMESVCDGNVDCEQEDDEQECGMSILKQG